MKKSPERVITKEMRNESQESMLEQFNSSMRIESHLEAVKAIGDAYHISEYDYDEPELRSLELINEDLDNMFRNCITHAEIMENYNLKEKIKLIRNKILAYSKKGELIVDHNPIKNADKQFMQFSLGTKAINDCQKEKDRINESIDDNYMQNTALEKQRLYEVRLATFDSEKYFFIRMEQLIEEIELIIDKDNIKTDPSWPVLIGEVIALSKWMNTHLKNLEHQTHQYPIAKNGEDRTTTFKHILPKFSEYAIRTRYIESDSEFIKNSIIVNLKRIFNFSKSILEQHEEILTR